MKVTSTMILAAVALAAGAPAAAQMQSDSMKKGSMSSGSEMKMSASEKKMMAKCKGMSHEMMMKDKGCMKMMDMHPDMMKSR